MLEIQQIVIASWVTPLISVLMFLVFIPGLKARVMLKEWSLGAAITCYLIANSTPAHDISSIILNTCALGVIFGLLIAYIPYCLRSWGFV